jgi:hypothetical protein
MTAPFAVTFFGHKSARFKREQMLTLPELVEMIKASTAERKDLLPWLKLARFGCSNPGSKSIRARPRPSSATARYNSEFLQA